MRPISLSARSQSRRGGTLLALLASVATGCEYPSEPYPFPTDAVPFEAPDIYSVWWGLVEACTGKVGDLGAISWYHAADPSGLLYRGQRVGGLYFSDGHRVLLDRQNINHGATVRHEMIHALAAPGGHPRQIFSEQCAHLQLCYSCGHSESQRGVANTAAEFNASVLEISIAAEPTEIFSSLMGGWFRLVVSAHNPRAEDIWILLPQEASFSWLQVFESGAAGTYTPTNETRWAFRAGETRRYHFDIRDTAGTHRFYANFGGKRSDTITVTVLP